MFSFGVASARGAGNVPVALELLVDHGLFDLHRVHFHA